MDERRFSDAVFEIMEQMRAMEKRRQDVFKMKLLCGDCEKRFSAWETRFASELFYRRANGDELFQYGPWLNQFAASLIWRSLKYRRHVGMKDPLEVAYLLHCMENHLSGYLLENREDLGNYTIHLYPIYTSDVPTSAPSDIGALNVKKYIATATDIGLMMASDLSGFYLCVKIPMFLFIAVVGSIDTDWLEPGRIRNSGTLRPGNNTIEKRVWPYIYARTSGALDLLNSMSKKSEEAVVRAVAKAIYEDPERVVNSKMLRMMNGECEI